MAFKKPKDYDSVIIGDYRILPAGGYICRIIKAEETQSRSGKDMLKIAFDICDGEFNGYFMEQFQSWKAAAESPQDVKWPFSGTKWVMVYDNEGKTNKDFKSLCTSLEEGGLQVWANGVFQTNALKNAEVGVVFRREEQKYHNERKWRTVPFRFRSVKAIEEGDFAVPDDKPIKDPIAGTGFEQVDSFSAAEDDIPF